MEKSNTETTLQACTCAILAEKAILAIEISQFLAGIYWQDERGSRK